MPGAFLKPMRRISARRADIDATLDVVVSQGFEIGGVELRANAIAIAHNGYKRL